VIEAARSIDARRTINGDVAKTATVATLAEGDKDGQSQVYASFLEQNITSLHEKLQCKMRRRLWATPKHVKNPETDRGHGEEIDGDQLLGAILQECAPGLRRRFAAAHHVFADAAFTDVDAEFEQFAMDAGCPPTGILSAHLADQISDFARNDGSPGLAVPHLPGPEQAKGGTDRTTTGGPPRSILGVLLRTSEARRFGGEEPGSQPQGQHVNGRSRTALQGVS